MSREAFFENGIMERPTTVLLDADFTIKEVIIGEIPQKTGAEFSKFIKAH